MNYFLLLWISINPDPVCFTIPFFGHPIAWYGCIFSLAFFVGYKIFIWIYARHSLNEIQIPEKFAHKEIPSSFALKKEQSKLYKFFEERVSDKTLRDRVKQYLYLEQIYTKTVPTVSSMANAFADAALLYIIAATVIGSRLGHILFYENILEYVKNPIMIIKTWEGGLASHGGIIAIIIAAYLFVKKQKKMSFLAFMDLISCPTMFVCAFIRIGNFINQEILGAPTTLPWAIIFQNPVDGGSVLPRHPMQLYEFVLYLSVSFLLFMIWKKNTYKKTPGLYMGLALAISFGGRFFLEFLKVPQSIHDSSNSLQVGQLLSIPMIAIGIMLAVRALKNKESLDKKVSEH